MEFHSNYARYYDPCFTTKETEAQELSNLTKVIVGGRQTVSALPPKPALVVIILETILALM